jgi:ATP-dependent helicase/nuclease subunit B
LQYHRPRHGLWKMADVIRSSLFTVPYGCDLSDAAVEAIFDRCGKDPLSLSQSLIFLPNNRAIRSLTEAFVRRASPGLLLPRLVAVGDLSLDEALGGTIDQLDSAASILPPIDPLNRLLILATLLKQYQSDKLTKISTTEALRLAQSLADVIDELEIEQVDFERFVDAKPDEMAEHWERSFGQLQAIVPAYYQELKSRKLMGPTMRRNMLLAQLSAQISSVSPDNFVAAIGIATSAPAVAKLLSNIAKLPNAMLILPTIDLDMDDAQWEMIGPHETVSNETKPKQNYETHPQFHMKLLLSRMNVNRGEFRYLNCKPPLHGQVIPSIFCLPKQTRSWLELPKSQKMLPNAKVLITEDSAEEARAIAIILREGLETPEQRMALITPDRELAVRVAAQLERWDIIVDDSAGKPLIQSTEGSLVLNVARIIAENFSAISVLSALKHPLVSAKEGRVAWLRQARKIDFALRGPTEGRGFDYIESKIAKLNEEEQFSEFWQSFCGSIQPILRPTSPKLAEVLFAIQQVAEHLTGGVIWQGTAGRQLARCFEDFSRADMKALGDIEHEALPFIIKELLSKAAVRPPYGGHPRIAIYGLLEARLQSADVVVCAGLNEGVWPQLSQPDPWLSPSIRRVLGLSALDRNIGLSAHDLAVVLGNKQVILSRTKRDSGGPTVASRFLFRIQALVGNDLLQETDAIQYARAIDMPIGTRKRFKRPAVKPNLEQRNVDISVTDFDKLVADPFAFYADKILRVKPKKKIDEDPSFAWRGTVTHDILHEWAAHNDSEPAALIARGQALFNNPALHPALRALWQPRILKGLQWIAQETDRLKREESQTIVAAEKKGYIKINGVNISGRVDRIDRLKDGTLAIIDYKSGGIPNSKQLEAGFALQLGLLGYLAEKGKFDGVFGEAVKFEYWSTGKQSKGNEFGYVKSPFAKRGQASVDAENLVDFAASRASDAISKWIVGAEAFVAKLHPEYAPYADYDQLMRLQEWDGQRPEQNDDIHD